MRRNQKEEDLRENHPYFDRPLFAVPRESKFRKICQTIVNARYDPKLKARKYRFGTLTHVTTYKGQKISEGNCGVLNSSKNTLASKIGQIKKIKAQCYTN